MFGQVFDDVWQEVSDEAHVDNTISAINIHHKRPVKHRPRPA